MTTVRDLEALGAGLQELLRQGGAKAAPAEAALAEAALTLGMTVIIDLHRIADAVEMLAAERTAVTATGWKNAARTEAENRKGTTR